MPNDFFPRKLNDPIKGSGCGTVDNVVASNTRRPGFESSNRHFYWTCLLLTGCRKDENKEKEAGHGPFFSKNRPYQSNFHASALFSVVGVVSATRLGNFWKFPVINCLTKVAQLFWACLGYFEIIASLLRTAVVTFLSTFGENWATF